MSNGGFSPSLQEIEVLRKWEDLTIAMAKHNRKSNCETLFYSNISRKQMGKCITYGCSDMDILANTDKQKLL